ncbi:MAG: GIY-YIG nuclease family protein [Pseudonocardia sp.]|nr:GIY-YIG nuclease family protein [Pseudonocardia sp.]
MTVYLIGSPGHDLVKIGHTGNLITRFRGLQLMSPIPLVVHGYWVGGPDEERRLHDEFADLRRHGEWFDFAGRDPLAAVAASLGEAAQQFEAPEAARRRGRRPAAQPHPGQSKDPKDWPVVNEMSWDLVRASQAEPRELEPCPGTADGCACDPPHAGPRRRFVEGGYTGAVARVWAISDSAGMIPVVVPLYPMEKGPAVVGAPR